MKQEKITKVYKVESGVKDDFMAFLALGFMTSFKNSQKNEI